jgi:hypothetical protein
LKKLEELVTKDRLDPFDCLGGVPSIGGLDQNGVKRGIGRNSASPHTSHSSLRSSSFALSIMCFSISSWISHSWNAAVSVLSRTPSKICENLKHSMSTILPEDAWQPPAHFLSSPPSDEFRTSCLLSVTDGRAMEWFAFRKYRR